jgi:hypothetical protein
LREGVYKAHWGRWPGRRHNMTSPLKATDNSMGLAQHTNGVNGVVNGTHCAKLPAFDSIADTVEAFRKTH